MLRLGTSSSASSRAEGGRGAARRALSRVHGGLTLRPNPSLPPPPLPQGYGPNGGGGGFQPGPSQGPWGGAPAGNGHGMGGGGPGGPGGGGGFGGGGKDAVDQMMGGLSPFARGMVAGYGGKAQEFMNTRLSMFKGSSLHYYFDVNTKYVLNKLKLLACPFLHRGSWTRLRDQVEGQFAFKPPRHDVNAPDLYIPVVGFYTYMVATCVCLTYAGNFTPEALGLTFWWAVFAWAGQIVLLKTSFSLISTGQESFQVPWLDLVSYGGYMFVHVALQVLAFSMFGRLVYYGALAWGSLCMGVFLVKTVKRILFSQSQYTTFDMKKYNYLLLIIAIGQLPIAYWLGAH